MGAESIEGMVIMDAQELVRLADRQNRLHHKPRGHTMRTQPTYEARTNMDLTQDRMKDARGDILRVADVNFPVPGLQETGLFVVPYMIEQAGAVHFALCDGTGKVHTVSPSPRDLILWVVRTFNDKACLTDMARGML